MLLLGCHKKEKPNSLENIRWGNHYVAEKVVKKEIRQLTDSNKYDQAHKWLDTLISLNKEKGWLYFERGFVEMHGFQNEAALKDFKIAESLHYDKIECQQMIWVNQKVIDGNKLIDEEIK